MPPARRTRPRELAALASVGRCAANVIKRGGGTCRVTRVRGSQQLNRVFALIAQLLSGFQSLASSSGWKRPTTFKHIPYWQGGIGCEEYSYSGVCRSDKQRAHYYAVKTEVLNE